MKNTNLKALLLASLMTLCACGETKESPKESTPAQSTPAESTPDQSTPAESTPTESTPAESTPEDVSTPAESTPEESISDSTPDIPQFDIKLNKYVYVKGDEFSKDNVDYFRRYNEDLGGYGTISSFKVSTLPEEVPNGPTTITLTAGRTKAEVTVYYYDTVELAAKNTVIELPEDVPMVLDLSVKRPTGVTGGFYMRDYLTSKGEVSVSNPFLEDAEQVLVRKGRGGISYDEVKITDPTWNADTLEIWRTGVPATLDPSKKTVEHRVDEQGKVVTTSNYEPERTSSMAIQDMKNYYAYDIIVDANGHIAYLGKVDYTGNPVDITGEEGYWSYYKDYTSNPAFIFASTFDANDPTHKFEYEKVIPEGGFWVIGVNDYGTQHSLTIDKVFQAMTGIEDANIYAFIRDNKLKLDISKKEELPEEETGEDDESSEEELIDDKELLANEENKRIESALQNSILKNISNGADQFLDVYNVANNFEKFACFYSKAYKAKNEALLTEAEEILKNLVYETLPAVAAEENLKAYYQSVTQVALDGWIAKFAEA